MKFKYIFFILVLFQSSFALTPEETLKEISGKLKASGDPAVVLPYINWDNAYKNFKVENGEQAQAVSMEQFKNHVSKTISNPLEALTENFNSKIEQVPEEQKAEAKNKMNSILEEVKKQMEFIKTKLKRTDFIVGAATVTGSSALVPMKISVDGEVKEDNVKMENVNGIWMLADFSLSAKKEDPKKGAPANKPQSPQKGK